MNTQEIKFSATKCSFHPEASEKDEWKRSSTKWLTRINGYEFEYYMGSGHKGKTPTLDDVLYSLLGDFQALEMTHKEFCNEFGYDPDSIKGLEIYNACKQNSYRLQLSGIDIDKQRERLQDY